MPTIYNSGVSLGGPRYSGLAIGYRVIDRDGVIITPFTSDSVTETTIPGNYTADIPLPTGFTGRVIWGTSTDDLAEEWVNDPTPTSQAIKAELDARGLTASLVEKLAISVGNGNRTTNYNLPQPARIITNTQLSRPVRVLTGYKLPL